GDAFAGDFDAEVAAGDHDAVEGVDDVLEGLSCLGFFDFGDDGEESSFFGHDAVDVLDVVAVADEGEGDDVGACAEGPAEVLDVFGGEGGDGDGGAGEVDAFVVGDEAAFGDAGVD